MEDQHCAGDAGWARLLWPHGGAWGSQSSAPSVFGLCLADACVHTWSALGVSGTCCLPPRYLEVAKSISARGHGTGWLGTAGTPGQRLGPWDFVCHGQGQGHHFLHKTLYFCSFSANGVLHEQYLDAAPDHLNGETSVHRALFIAGFHAFPFPSLFVSLFLLSQKDVESSLLSFARQLAATPRLSLACAEQLMGPWGCSRAGKLFPASAGPRQRAAASSRPIPPNVTRF